MTNPAQPSISVVVATYNRCVTLGRALDSVRGQTFPAREVIVVDDGSTDGTVAHHSGVYPEVQFIALPRNAGAAHARNVGLEAARGEIIAFLDSDDWWEPEYLRESVFAFQRSPGAVMAVSDIHMVLLYGDKPAEYVHQCRPVGGYRNMVEHLLLHNFIATMSCVAVLRSAVEAAGPLDETLRVVHDKEWYIRLSTQGGIACTEQALVWRYIADDNLVADLDRFLADNLGFLRRFFATPTGAAYRDLRWRVRSATYQGFAAMSLGRQRRWTSARYSLMAFVYACYDLHFDSQLFHQAFMAVYGALRTSAGKLLRQWRR